MKLPLFVCLLIPVLCHGQDSTHIVGNAVNYLEKSVWRIEFFGPGVINESRIG